MAIQEEYKLDRFGSIRPPRNVMLGGLARATAAGQQSTNAAIAGGATGSQTSSAMSAPMQSLLAGLEVDQASQKNARAMTEVRRMSVIDQMNDSRASLDAQFKAAEPDFIDKVAMGGKIALVASSIAGRVEDAGTKDVTTAKPMLDDAGNPVLDAKGKPITYDEKTQQLSGAAKVAAKVQNVIGTIIPSVKRDVKARREDELSRLEKANLATRTLAEERATNAARHNAVVSSLDGIDKLITSLGESAAYNADVAGETARFQRDLEEIRAQVGGGYLPRYASRETNPDEPFIGPPNPKNLEWTPPETISADSLAAVGRYDKYFEQYGKLAGLDPLLLKAHALVESGGNTRAVSWAGAQGLMQFMPATAQQYGLQNPFDPVESIRASSDYLKHLTGLFDGDMTYAVAAYNAGEGNVQRSGLLKSGNYTTKVKWFYKKLGGTQYWSDQ